MHTEFVRERAEPGLLVLGSDSRIVPHDPRGPQTD